MKTQKPISDGQRRLIFGLARRLALEDDELHGVVERITGTPSIKELTSYKAKLVADYLKRLLGEEKTTPRNRPTESQRQKIHALLRELGWDKDEKRFRAFLEKRYRVSDIRFLPDKQTNNVIEALKAISKGGRAERKGYVEVD